jgi:acyl-CoA thioester hydrolase
MNPPDCFATQVAVYFDDLDLNGHLHNSRLITVVERAQTALFESLGGGWTAGTERQEDLRYVVRELHVEFLAPVSSPGTLTVAMQAAQIGRTSARYGFRVTDADGTTVATGHRAVVKVDDAGRPLPWTPWYRQAFEAMATGAPPQPMMRT